MYRGDFEQRIKQLVDEVRDHSDVMLFVTKSTPSSVRAQAASR